MLVTVTYGDRVALLSEALERSFAEPAIAAAVVVSNGSRSDLEPLLRRWGERLQIVRVPENSGSANGYRIGIEAALDRGADYLFLMDDDNAPTKGSVARLMEELIRLKHAVGPEKAAVLGYRPSNVNFYPLGSRAKAEDSSFFGFHMPTLPRRIIAKFGPVRSRSASALPNTVDLPYAAYGGLLASRAMFERMGPPRVDFVLYADDTEYTLRFTKNGGTIRLVTTALLEDLEPSWYNQRKTKTGIASFLQEASDFRVYYSFRNHAWVSKNMRCASRPVYLMNRTVFLAALYLVALGIGRLDRYRFIIRAIRDGEHGDLGVNSRISLP